MQTGQDPNARAGAPAEVVDRGRMPGSTRIGRGKGRALVRIGGGALLLLLMLAPAIVAIAALAGRPWFPVDDFGIIDLRVRDVWSWETPLTGPWSRLGWNHPGPVMFWLRWPVSVLSGGAPWGTRVGGAVIEAVAVGWLAWVTWNRSTRMLLAAATVTVLGHLALGPWLFRQPWEPNVAIPWFTLFLFLTLLTATGSFRQLIAMTAVGTVLVQTQVGYVLLVGVCFLWAVVLVIHDARRRGEVPERWRSVVAVSAGLALVLWSFPLLDLVVNWSGNLGALLGFAVRGDVATVGFADAVGHVAAEFRWLPPWLGGELRVEPTRFAALPSTGWLLLVPFGAAAVAFVAGRVSGSRPDRRWVGLAVVVLIAGVLSISNADEPRPYTFQWRAFVAAFLVVACVWTIAAAVAPRVGPALRVLAVACVVALVGWAGVTVAVDVGTAATYTGLEARGPELAAVMEQLRPQLPPPGRAVRLVPDGAVHSMYAGLAAALDREGVDIRVGSARGRVYGSGRVARARDVDEDWYVRQRGSGGPSLLAEPGARVLARSGLDPAESAELTRLQLRLTAQLRKAGREDLLGTLGSSLVGFTIGTVPGIDRRAVTRVATLNSKVERAAGCNCTVTAVRT